MVHRIARGRRYDVTSDGNKFHGLYHQALMKEEARQKTQRRKLQQQQEEAERVPWDYKEQNRTNAELLLGLSAGNNGWETCKNNTESKAWASNLGTGPAKGVPFNLDGCKHEWCVFDIRQHSSGSSPDGYGRERERLQLDSGYYIEEEARLALQDGAEHSSKSQEVVPDEVEKMHALN